MRNIRYRLLFFALLALVFVFAGCKGESPTSPTPVVGNPQTPGGTTPPTGAAVVLTASNPTPLVSSTSVITATVTLNGAVVPNGTAVEFSTNLGTFTDSAAQTTIRTTTNGVATATLTAALAGTATVTAVVNNVTQKIQVAFQSTPVIPTTPDTTPTIGSITPVLGRPQGGETITINGTNFRAPARVIFDFGGGKTKDAFIVSLTPTKIVVVTPSVDLTTGQQQIAAITVIDEAGTAAEQKVTLANAFTFQSDILTPSITAVSPASGPIDGGTRVTIFGDGFQSPVQVFFGSAEAQVVSVNFKQLIVMSPTARDTSSNGSQTVTGPVEIKIININSNTTVTSSNAFRYVAKAAITAITPNVGSSLGGTDIKIDGIGFNDPVTVDIQNGGTSIRAQTIRVSSTEIVARTAALPSPCSGGTGTITVTNVDNGDSAASTQTFTYIGVPPVITNVSFSSLLTIGGSVSVTVQNPGVGPLGSSVVGFNIGDKPAATNPSQISTGTGSQTFTLIVPTGYTFPSVSCTVGALTGTQLGPISVPLTFTNSNGCTATTSTPVIINPPGANVCVTGPSAAVIAPPSPACVVFPGTTASGSSSAPQTITIKNNGGTALSVTGASITGTNSGDFSITPPSQTIAPGATGNFSVIFSPTAAGTRNGTATFTTNDPANPTLTVCLTGTGT
jgi:hypothetical protein